MNITREILNRKELALANYHFWNDHAEALQEARKRNAFAGNDESPELNTAIQIAECRSATARFEWAKLTRR